MNLTQAIATVALALMGFLAALRWITSDPHSPPLLRRLCVLLIMTLFALMLGGCKTAPVEGPPMKDPADSAACAPLPTCQIPEKASSTQLEQALWECVLEYRALYSVCYYMQHRTPEK